MLFTLHVISIYIGIDYSQIFLTIKYVIELGRHWLLTNQISMRYVYFFYFLSGAVLPCRQGMQCLHCSQVLLGYHPPFEPSYLPRNSLSELRNGPNMKKISYFFQLMTLWNNAKVAKGRKTLSKLAYLAVLEKQPA